MFPETTLLVPTNIAIHTQKPHAGSEENNTGQESTHRDHWDNKSHVTYANRRMTMADRPE